MSKKAQDPGWEHAYPPIEKDRTQVKCKYCQNEYNGGMSRFKRHLAGIRGMLLLVRKFQKKSIDSSLEVHVGPFIFKLVSSCIDEIGEENVVQVISNNASANMAAANLLRAERPNIFWTPCAAYCIDLMLEDIGKFRQIKNTITKARMVTVFLYGHMITLSMMRKFAQKKDLVRTGVTRFATAFLSLQSIMLKRNELRTMFTSKDWDECKWSKMEVGKRIQQIVLSNKFWNGKNSPVWNIIDSRFNDKLKTPLHKVGYFLNPFFYYAKKDEIDSNAKKDEIDSNASIIDGVLECLLKFYPNDPTPQAVKEIGAPGGPFIGSGDTSSAAGISVPYKYRWVLRPKVGLSAGCRRLAFEHSALIALTCAHFTNTKSLIHRKRCSFSESGCRCQPVSS
uniref:BED-type domain-containing protein n=1 Tax=Ananas comosus var. bracteatus TaxID=296719 RepID=A0A6V7PI96_ANACO|nr:unnamed protein product [Ananas comosus var. bracteatus]